MLIIVAALAGLVFGLGLIVAGMADPSKVLAFLDLAGNWNPSLALVMVGAIGVAALPFALMRNRKTSLLGAPLQIPASRQLDRRLIVGSLIFGVGWGIAGICPGPALVLVGSGVAKGVGFLLALLVGILIADKFLKKL
ncbi:MAG: hypothetical protein RL748_2534 [Pseudomonadota bacterium]|jgi:uncharacterized membrane protein YedE/YeeE